MPRLRRPPSYRLHKARGCAVVTIDGRNHYLGKHGSEESCKLYEQLIAAWKARSFRPAPSKAIKATNEPKLMIELCAAYMAHANTYYVKAGKATGAIYGIRALVKLLTEHCGHVVASEFNSAHVHQLLDVMVAAKLARPYINEHLGRLKRIRRCVASSTIL